MHLVVISASGDSSAQYLSPYWCAHREGVFMEEDNRSDLSNISLSLFVRMFQDPVCELIH